MARHNASLPNAFKDVARHLQLNATYFRNDLYQVMRRADYTMHDILLANLQQDRVQREDGHQGQKQGAIDEDKGIDVNTILQQLWDNKINNGDTTFQKDRDHDHLHFDNVYLVTAKMATYLTTTCIELEEAYYWPLP
eukprot:890575-Amphidinium_carterae.1